MDQNKSPNSPLKTHLNFPILLLLIATLLNIRSIFYAITNIFSTVFSNPLNVLSPIISLFSLLVPTAIAVLLWAHRREKIQEANKTIGLVLVLYAASNVYFMVSNLANLLTSTVSIINLAMMVIKTLIYVLLAYILLKNSGSTILFRFLSGLYIVSSIFFGVLDTFIYHGSFFSILPGVVIIFALWFVPNVWSNPPSAEINQTNTKFLVGIICLALALFVVGGIATDSNNSSSSSSSSSVNHECHVCGEKCDIKYGSYYYCPTHYAYVKTVVENS